MDTLRFKNFGGRRQVLGVGGRGYIFVDFTSKIPTRSSQGSWRKIPSSFQQREEGSSYFFKSSFFFKVVTFKYARGKVPL